jgi:hypothetical protein
MIRKLLQNKKGVSAIEIVIYISLLLVLTVCIIASVLQMTTYLREVKKYNETRRSGALAMERMIREMRTMDQVIVASSTLGSSPASLGLRGPNNTSLLFRLSGQSTIEMVKNGSTTAILSSENVTISNFIFRMSTTTKSIGIKIELSLTSESGGGNPKSQDFYSSVVLRSAY